jgi:hypothetical protein
MLTFHVVGQVAIIGIGATAVMDAWLALLSRLGVPTTSFAMVGRWVGHFARGRFRHAAIAKAAPIRCELALGWLIHYAIGIACAAMLVITMGADWLAQPTAWPALAIGIVTVAAPWFVMQPAMGAGIAATRTPTPLKNSLRSLANHAVFGLGLYLAAEVITEVAG